ncbi:MAG TPA: winged helix-turn-helix domain-containing protein [Anaerolineales bacterium]|nr:winged helix-turn-helix domain-containing protein [Anaerolineales bacterium]
MQNFEISDISTLRAISTPLRLKLLENLAEKPYTVKQLGELLGMDASRLYYHISQLEKAGIVKVVSTQQVGNLVEKYYQTTSHTFTIAPDLLHQMDPTGTQTIRSAIAILNTAREELQAIGRTRAIGESPSKNLGLVTRERLYLSAAQATAFKRALTELIAPYLAPSEGSTPFSCTIAIYEAPLHYSPEDEA